MNKQKKTRYRDNKDDAIARKISKQAKIKKTEHDDDWRRDLDDTEEYDGSF